MPPRNKHELRQVVDLRSRVQFVDNLLEELRNLDKSFIKIDFPKPISRDLQRLIKRELEGDLGAVKLALRQKLLARRAPAKNKLLAAFDFDIDS